MMLTSAKTWAERFRDAFIYAVVLVVMLFGAAAVTSGSQAEIARQIEVNTRESAEQVEAMRQLIEAQTCVLVIVPEDRSDRAVRDCFDRAGITP